MKNQSLYYYDRTMTVTIEGIQLKTNVDQYNIFKCQKSQVELTAHHNGETHVKISGGKNRLTEL